MCRVHLPPLDRPLVTNTSHAWIFTLDCIICCLLGLSSGTCDLIESNNKNSLWEVGNSYSKYYLTDTTGNRSWSKNGWCRGGGDYVLPFSTFFSVSMWPSDLFYLWKEIVVDENHWPVTVQVSSKLYHIFIGLSSPQCIWQKNV
jgi:hypothetical protein